MIHFIYNPSVTDIPAGNYLLDAAKRRGIPVSWSPKGIPKGIEPTLVIKVDDGDIDNNNYSDMCNCPTAWWFIDGNTDSERGASIAKNFDYTFCSQPYNIEDFINRGFVVNWLPCACDPVHHTTIFPSLESRPIDVGFSGSIGDSGGWNKARPSMLQKVSENFKNSIIQESTKGQNGFINGSCKVIFNDNPYNNINMRHFEAISSGAVLVTKRVSGNGEEHIPISDSVLFYDTEQEAIDQIKYAITNIKRFEEPSVELAMYYQQTHSYDVRLLQINEAIKSYNTNETHEDANGK